MSATIPAHVKVQNGFDENAPELQLPLTITIGNHSTSKDWRPAQITVAALLALCAKHDEGEKDGPAIMLCDHDPGPRSANKVRSIGAIGLDIDIGVPTAMLDAKLADLGCVAIRYTTHTHGKALTEVPRTTVTTWAERNGMRDGACYLREWFSAKVSAAVVDSVDFDSDCLSPDGRSYRFEHDPIEKHRVIVPLRRPFVISDAGGHHQAANEWKSFVAALANALDVEHDIAAVDLARIYFLPRHKSHAPYSCTISGGRVLDLSDLAVPATPSVTKIKARPHATERGQSLRAWYRDGGYGFEIAQAVLDHAPERVRRRTAMGVEIECPHDHLHSNPGDPSDTGCLAVNAGAGDFTQSFIVKCQHQGCQTLSNLDHLGAMIDQGWLDADIMLDEDYNALALTPPVEAPIKLSETSTGADIEKVVSQVFSKGLSELDREREWKRIARETKLGVTAIKKVAAQLKPVAAHAPRPDQGRFRQLEEDFPRPPASYALTFYDNYEGRPWLWEDNGPEVPATRLHTPIAIRKGTIAMDEGGRRGVRIEVLNEDGVSRASTLKATDMTTAYGAAIKTHIREEGVGQTEEGGKFFVKRLLEAVPPNPIEIYSRPGWRGDPILFITPWGSASQTNREVELSADVIPPGEEIAGTLDGWRAASAALWQTDVVQWKATSLASLASPILDLCQQDSVFVALTGRTSKGKTTALRYNASAWGCTRPRQGLLGTLSSTEAAREARFAQGSGCGYNFDECSSIHPEELISIVYKGTGGTGNDRLDRNSALRKGRRWSAVYTISGEHSFGTQMRANGKAPNSGMGTRVLELDCTEIATQPPEVMEKIESAFANHGHAGQALVQEMLDQGLDHDPASLWESVEHKARLLAGPNASAAVVRAARIPALLWRAGELAQSAALVPSDEDLGDKGLEPTIRAVWALAQESDLTPSSAEDRAISTLFEQLIRHRGGRISEGLREISGGIDGWRLATIGTNDTEVYVILRSALASYAGGALHVNAVIKALRAGGHLVLATQDRSVWPYIPGIGRVEALVIRADAVEGEPVEIPLAA